MGELRDQSLNDLDKVAERLLKIAEDVKVIAFKGNLGAGKTTLISHLVKKLGINEFSGSPTFSLVNEYISLNALPIYHFDFYRINDENEAHDIGLEEYFNNDRAWIFIEWPQKIENLLPEHFLLVDIEVVGSLRTFKWKLF